MAKIVDPDALAQTTDVIYDTSAKTIQIVITGAINDDSPGKTSGVTGQCIYSFTKEEWKSDAALNKFKFPIKMIYAASFQLINGWSFADQQSIDVIRDAGFQSIVDTEDYSCIISLGAIDSTPTSGAPYYANVVGFDQTVNTFDKDLELNENILIDNGTTDTSDYLKLFLREYSKLYAEYDLHFEQGLAALSYEAYKLPLSNGNDAKIVNDDTFVSGANDPYQNMTIDYIVGDLFVTATVTSYATDNVIQDTAGRWARCTTGGTMDAAGVADYTNNGGTAVWEIYPGEKQVGTNYYAFNRIVDDIVSAVKPTVSQAHTFCQWSLRQATDINDNVNLDAFGTVNGNVATPLTAFIGDQLHTNPGVYIANTHADDNSNITYWDITVDGGGVDAVTSVPVTSTDRNNPFFSSFTLVFSDNLLSEGDGDGTATQFRMYFTDDSAGDNAGNNFDTSGAIVVEDATPTNITGNITTAGAPYTFQYAYDTNNQRGAASTGDDAPVTVSFQGLDGSEISTAEFTITRSTGLTFNCITPDELNYNNPT